MRSSTTLERPTVDQVPGWVTHLAATFDGTARSICLRDTNRQVVFQSGPASFAAAGADIFPLFDLHDRPVGMLEIATSDQAPRA